MWKELIEELLQSGMTEAQIAAAAGCTQPTINRLRNGVTEQPSWPIGQRLMEMAGRAGTCACRENAA